MKILTLVVVVFLSFLLSADGQTVIFGMDTSATAGMSYKNPAIGGFADLRWQKSRLVSVNTIELANDQKVFEPNGSTLRGRTEIGMFITPTIAVTGLVGFSRHTNVDYTKTALSPGVGLRKYFGKGFHAYARYAFPDATSPNEVSSIGGGGGAVHSIKKRIRFILGGFRINRQIHSAKRTKPKSAWFQRFGKNRHLVFSLRRVTRHFCLKGLATRSRDLFYYPLT